MSYKPLKVAAAKKLFPSVFIIDTTCSNKCFSFHVITANSIFYTNLSLPRDVVQLPCCFTLSNKCFERSLHFIYIHYLHSNITMMLIWQRLKIKLLLLNFLKNLFADIVFFCKCSTLYFINEIFKTQKLPRGMFLLRAIMKFL